MRFSAPLLTLAGTVAGSAAAVVAYQATASVGTPATTPAADTTTPTPATTTSWLPCEAGWKVKGDTCVRVKEKVVVVRDLPAPAEDVAPAATTPTTPADTNEGDGQSHTRTRHADDSDVEDATDDSDAEDAADDDSTETEHASDDGSEHEDVGHDD